MGLLALNRNVTLKLKAAEFIDAATKNIFHMFSKKLKKNRL